MHRGESGTRCSRPAFMRGPGMVQVLVRQGGVMSFCHTLLRQHLGEALGGVVVGAVALGLTTTRRRRGRAGGRAVRSLGASASSG